MGHGAGGTVMQDLISKYILHYLGGSNVEVPLEALDDAAVVGDVVLKTDCHTVKPIFFPGGDIGKLSVAGTVNDIAVLGAKPAALAAGFVIEEGLVLKDLEKITKSMGDTCKEAGVYIITGDTKVMERGAIDQFVITTSGVGFRTPALEDNLREVRRYRSLKSRWILDTNIHPGDRIIVSGSVGDHGIAILSFREGYDFKSKIVSDVTPLNHLIENLLKIGGVVAMKDPTRGGLSNTLNEWSSKSQQGIIVREEAIPVKRGVQAACDMLGIDPLEIGNEGKIVIGVVQEKAEEILKALKKTKEGKDASIIGEVTSKVQDVIMETEIGGSRILTPPSGDPIPRIC
jgi:hydrogenase expression/formation protein HypE